ncbi:phage protein [Clostridium polyendosporum]|uniref:Phage protein n=1 Tax=Clostridium polyendosporum TaxID=69208 RepID=A0A919S277_9CLOT|nr:RusA family crossover junction endodeoxyribonuclease [Clostridium polyendosporum]GIM29875.1 phage protein [Clostridium polyendosporum]
MIKVTILGDPKGKGRPRMSTKSGVAYTPKDTIMYENLVRHEYAAQRGEKLLGAINAKITAFYSIPKSVSKKKRQEMIEGKIRPIKKPDTDNVAKIVLDSLNKIAFDDDSQVVSLSVDKYYSDNPRVELTLESVQNA